MQSLQRVWDRYFGGDQPPLDWLAIRGSHRKVFYYDAIPVQQASEDDNTHAARVAPKRAELAHIERQKGFHVRTGDVRHRRRRGNEQKMVDVQLSVDALLTASRGVFSECTIITGDLDFKPLLTALVDMGVDVSLVYPSGETNEELMAAADSAVPIDIQMCLGWVENSYPAKKLLPWGQYTFSSGALPVQGSLFNWNDSAFGQCLVRTHDGVSFEVLTEIAPNMPSHRLVLTGKDKKMLRTYSEDVFHLNIPEQGW